MNNVVYLSVYDVAVVPPSVATMNNMIRNCYRNEDLEVSLVQFVEASDEACYVAYPEDFVPAELHRDLGDICREVIDLVDAYRVSRNVRAVSYGPAYVKEPSPIHSSRFERIVFSLDQGEHYSFVMVEYPDIRFCFKTY